MDNTLWVEKYRPKLLADCVLPDRIEKTIRGYIEKNDLPNLMLFGTQGSGKTTVAKCLINELQAESLFIDASSDNGKQMIQDSVIPFASTVSIMNGSVPKVILMDESDGLTPQAQQALRPNIELYSKAARFIFTGNYSAKFIPALKSRCVQFDFSIKKEDKPELMLKFFKRVSMILEENNIEYDKRILAQFISELFPDYRKIINEIQGFSTAYGKITEGILTARADTISSSIYPLLKSKKFEDVRRWTLENTNTSDDIFRALFNTMPEYIEQKKQPEVILILADYQFKSSSVANQTLNLLACFVEIMSIL